MKLNNTFLLGLMGLGFVIGCSGGGPVDPGETPGPPTPTPGTAKTYLAPDWHTDRGSYALLAAVNESVQLPLSVRWQVDLPGQIHAPATGAFGQLYLPAGNSLYALSPQDGGVQWVYPAETPGTIPIFNPIATFSENKGQVQTLFLVDGLGHLHAIQAQNGTREWRIENPQPNSYASAPVSAGNQVFFIRNKNAFSVLRVYSPTGELQWEKNTNVKNTNTPLYGFGSLFLSSCSNGSYPFARIAAATGAVEWEYKDSGNYTSACFSNAVLDSDLALNQPARVYFGHREDPPMVRAVRVSSGTSIWEKELTHRGEIKGMALSQNRPDNALIVAQADRLYRIDRETGAILWEHSFESNVAQNPANHLRVPQPIIWGDYVFHVTEGRKVLKALNLSTGEEAWRFELNAPTNASPIAGGKTLYLGTESGRFYAFTASL